MDLVYTERHGGLTATPVRDDNWSTFRPTRLVRAVCMNEPFQISRDGKAIASGLAGDYLVEGDDGVLTVVAGSEFRLTHEQVA